MPRRYRYETALLLLLALPLLPWVWSVAELFPNWNDTSEIVTIDDRYVLIVRSSYPNTYIPELHAKYRYMLLDRKTGWLRRLHAPSGPYPEGGSPFVISPGRMLWFTRNESWWLHVIEPSAGLVRSVRSPYDQMASVGSRYVISWTPNEDFAWLDLQERELRWKDYRKEGTQPINPAHANFNYDPARFFEYQDYDVSPDSPSYLRVDSSVRRLSLLVLYQLTSDGPQEVARWPVAADKSGVHGHSPVLAEGPYIFCSSLVANEIDVHSSDTGQVVAHIPLPTAAGTAAESWLAHRYAVRVSRPTGMAIYDPSTGLELLSDPYSGYVPSRVGQRYLTLASSDSPMRLGMAGTWPPRVQVRHYPDGKVLFSFLLPKNLSIGWEIGRPVKLSPDGQRVLVHTQAEQMLVLDALTGQVQEVIGPSVAVHTFQVLIVLLFGIWMAACAYSANRAGVPRLITLLAVSAVWIGFMIARWQLSGHPYDEGRLAVLIIFAIVISWGAELMQHVSRPGVTARNRTLALAVYMIIFYALVLMTQIIHAEYLTYGVIINGLFGVFYLCLRAMKRLPPYSRGEGKSQFTIGSILIVTAFAAIGVSFLYHYSWFVLQYLPYPGTLVIAFTILCVLSGLVLATRHAAWFRLIAIPFTLTAASLVSYNQLRLGVYSGSAWSFSAFAACVAITSCFRVVPSARKANIANMAVPGTASLVPRPATLPARPIIH